MGQLEEKLSEEAFNRRQVYIWKEIDNELAASVIQQLSFLSELSPDPIFLLINSGGGDMDAQAAIIDEMVAVQQQQIEVFTFACGIAYSAAAAILAMGTKGRRFVRPNSAIMLHPASLHLEYDYEGNQRILMNFLTKRCDLMNKMIAQACGMSEKYDKFLSDIDKGLWLSAEEAVKYGVVDGIWNAPLPYIRETEDEEESNQ